MSKKKEPEPEKSGADQVLEALGPRLDKIEKELTEIHNHRAPKEKAEKQTDAAISSGSNEDNHRALKQQHPDWKFCPYGDNCGELPDAEIDPVNVASPDNRAVTCTNCGTSALEKWKRCPGCGATANFEYAD